MTIHLQFSFSQGTFRQLPNSFSHPGSTFITYSYVTHLSVNWTFCLWFHWVSINLVTLILENISQC